MEEKNTKNNCNEEKFISETSYDNIYGVTFK